MGGQTQSGQLWNYVQRRNGLSCLYICAYTGVDDAVNLRMGKMGGIKRKGLGKG